MLSVIRLLIIPLLTLNLSGPAEPQRPSYAERAEVQLFATQMAEKYGKNKNHWLDMLAKSHYQAQIATLVMPVENVPNKKNWQTYRQRFIEPLRIRNGVQFWKTHEGTLQRAEKEYGIPIEIIVSIIGIETLYGKNTGSFSVLDALATLSFDYPNTPNQAQRSALFREELSYYLQWCDNNNRSPEQARGSYTGAMGIPQFMPSSLRNYGVKFDRGETVDLENSPIDAIGSVANFLKQHGWEIGRPVAWKIADDAHSSEVAKKYADGLPMPHFYLHQLTNEGLKLDSAVNPIDVTAEANTPVLIIDLPTPGQATQHWVGLQNFYALTRYNQSFFYALSVYELAQAIRLAKINRDR